MRILLSNNFKFKKKYNSKKKQEWINQIHINKIKLNSKEIRLQQLNSNQI
jgi:hypothetical protein